MCLFTGLVVISSAAGVSSAAAIALADNSPGRNGPVPTEYRLDPAKGNTGPFGITRGPDGAMWFAWLTANRVVRIDDEGNMRDFVLPTTPSGPRDIATGPDRALWIVESQANPGKIARLTLDGTFTEFPVPGPYRPHDITTGGDGALWFTLFPGNEIGRMTTDGKLTEFEVQTANPGLQAIARGRDGVIWFIEVFANKIGRIDELGRITELALPLSPGSRARALAVGPDQNIWFTEFDANKIGRLTDDGVVTEFALPAHPPDPLVGGLGGMPYGIVAGPDHALWFGENAFIGRITTEGDITEFPFPLHPFPSSFDVPARVRSIATGEDGTLWFTEFDQRVGSFRPGECDDRSMGLASMLGCFGGSR